MTIPPGQNLGDIRLGDLTLNTVDEFGCSWIVQDLDGWWNLPEADLPDDPRAYQYDGSYETDGRFKARDITLTGICVPQQNTINSVAAARRRLLDAVIAVRKSIELQVDESDAPKTAACRLSGRPQLAVSTLNGVLSFQIPLRAPDPRKYSQQIFNDSTPVAAVSGGRTYNLTFPRVYPGGASAGVMSLTNNGDYETGATFTIFGPVSGPSLEHFESGSILMFDIDLAIGDRLDIDLLSHSIILNGTASRRNALVNSSSWFLLQPGSNTIRFNGTSVGGPFTAVSYQSAWIS